MEENNFTPTGLQNGVYILLTNESQTRACMDFNPISNRYSEELIQSSFNRECQFLVDLKSYNVEWIPDCVNIDIGNRRIYFNWYNNTCENLLPSNWKQQLELIVKDLHKYKIYKPSFYPKCFYTDNNGNLKTYSFYTSCNYNDCIVDVDFYKPILNLDRLELVERLAVDNKLDVSLLIEKAFLDYIKWPDDALKEIYLKVLKSNSE